MNSNQVFTKFNQLLLIIIFVNRLTFQIPWSIILLLNLVFWLIIRFFNNIFIYRVIFWALFIYFLTVLRSHFFFFWACFIPWLVWWFSLFLWPIVCSMEWIIFRFMRMLILFLDDFLNIIIWNWHIFFIVLLLVRMYFFGLVVQFLIDFIFNLLVLSWQVISLDVRIKIYFNSFCTVCIITVNSIDKNWQKWIYFF